MPRSIILSLALIAAPSLIAQTVHTTADMQQREAKLLATAKAAPTGLGTDIMDDYGNDRTLLVVRVHSGDPERHQFWADQMVVKKGTITLVTGGPGFDSNTTARAAASGRAARYADIHRPANGALSAVSTMAQALPPKPAPKLRAALAPASTPRRTRVAVSGT